MNTIPNKIKQIVKRSLKVDVKELKKEFPNIKNQLNIKPGTYSISYGLQSRRDYKQFASDNSQILRNKYENLIASSGLSISPADGRTVSDAALDHFIDNFYEYLVYYLAECDDFNSTFESKWQEFVSELFALSNKLSVVTRVKNFYCHGWLENIIPWDFPKLYWARSAFEFRLLGWERNGGLHFNYLENFQPPWILLKDEFEVKSPNQIRTNVEKIIDKFNLVMFVIRSDINRGNPYFNNVRLFGFGHYSPSGIISTSLINIFDNDIHEEFGDAVTVQNPLDTFLRSLFNKIDPNCYPKFEFIDWQLRMTGKLEIDYRISYSRKRTRYHLFQKLLNLTSMLNSLLPDLNNDDHDNRKICLTELLTNIYSMDRLKLESTFENVYHLRNKIAHGDINAINRIMGSTYRDPEVLKEDLRFLEYIITRVVLITLVNPNFKELEENYFKSKNPSVLPTLIMPYA